MEERTNTGCEADPFDLDAFLATQAGQDALLNHALAIGDTGPIAAALGLVARMRGMSALAARTGMSRQQLYRSLDAGRNPTLGTFVKVTNALGYRLSVERYHAEGEGSVGRSAENPTFNPMHPGSCRFHDDSSGWGSLPR